MKLEVKYYVIKVRAEKTRASGYSFHTPWIDVQSVVNEDGSNAEENIEMDGTPYRQIMYVGMNLCSLFEDIYFPQK